jgi:transposase
MSYEKRADYSETYLFPRSLEDWVGADHPARFVREVVDVLDLGELGFKRRESKDGRPNYAADLLLKVWLYGYLMRIRSSRQLERACRENVGLIWLTGMNEPDHNTLWRFFSENKRALRKVFKQVVRVAFHAKLIGMVLHAVDGTKITAQASRRTAWHKADLEKVLRRLDESIEQMMSIAEEAEKKERGGYRLPVEFIEKEQLRKKIKEALTEMEEAETKDFHPKEKDARMMNCAGKGGRREFGYNAQAVADAESGLIVAAEVVNEADDHGLLVPMIGKVEEALGQAAEETLADCGYRSAAELRRAEDHGYSVIVALGRQGEDVRGAGEYHPSKFRYDEQNDQCICPRGEVLSFKSRSGSNRYPVRVYQCRSYKECPARWQCSRAKSGRKIELSIFHDSLMRQREKHRNKEKQAALKRRQVIIEPAFAHIKQAMDFRRFTHRGLESVRTQWSLLCTTANLSKLYKCWLSGIFSLKDASIRSIGSVSGRLGPRRLKIRQESRCFGSENTIPYSCSPILLKAYIARQCPAF